MRPTMRGRVLLPCRHLGVRHELGHLLKPDLGLAARDQDADAAVRTAGGEPGFRRHLGGDAEPLEHTHHVGRRDAAARRRGVSDGLCRDQRASQRFGRRHVGPGRALAHRDADAGAREVGTASHDLALPDERVDRRAVGQEDVNRLTALEARDQRAGRRIARPDGVAVPTLERRQQFVGHGLDRGRDERVDLGGPGRRGRGQQHDEDCECACKCAHDDPDRHRAGARGRYRQS